jgi:non-canonical (house-cleaning) NTP pyrophosphatase
MSASAAPRLRVVVGSTNPVKLAAARLAFDAAFPAGAPHAVRGVAAASGVPAQPRGDAETRRGALARARNALAAVLAAAGDLDAVDFAVGMEGGVGDEAPLEEEAASSAASASAPAALAPAASASASAASAAAGAAPGGGATPSLEVFAYMCVVEATTRRVSFSRSASFVLPPPVAELVRAGAELGSADDAYFGRSNGKQHDGTVGMLTRGSVTRTQYYVQPTVLALLPWSQREHYRT